jgi:hypothetical protein
MGESEAFIVTADAPTLCCPIFLRDSSFDGRSDVGVT